MEHSGTYINARKTIFLLREGDLGNGHWVHWEIHLLSNHLVTLVVCTLFSFARTQTPLRRRLPQREPAQIRRKPQGLGSLGDQSPEDCSNLNLLHVGLIHVISPSRLDHDPTSSTGPQWSHLARCQWSATPQGKAAQASSTSGQGGKRGQVVEIAHAT